MNRNEIEQAVADVGGLKEFVRLAKKDVRTRLQFFSMFLPKLLNSSSIDAPHVESNREQELFGVIERALFGAVGALYSKAPATTLVLETPASSVDVANSDVRDAVSSDAGAAHGNVDIGMKEAAVPQALHDGGITNTPHRKRRLTEQPISSCVASVLNAPPKPKPLPPPPLEVKVAAPAPAAPREPNNNELFLEWSGRQRMDWSPPASWRGY